jgi:N-ethylmaleimide reductase
LFEHVAKIAKEAKLAFLHVLEQDQLGGPGAGVDYAAIKNAFGGVYIANLNYDKTKAETALAKGRADAVAFGRAFIANPDLVTRLQLNAPLNEGDANSYYGGSEAGYTDYPLLTKI